MVPHSTEGGNSLLLRAISSQNKNISFRRKSQINTGFAWSGFYLPKNCYFLAHFIRWMRDGSWELGKMSFMRAHTHPISLTGSRSLRNADSPSFFLFFPLCLTPSHTHTHTHTHTQNIPNVHIQYIHMQVFHPTSANGLLFSAPPCISDIKGASWLWMSPLDVTTLLCQVFTSMVCLPRLISRTKTFEQAREGQWRIT